MKAHKALERIILIICLIGIGVSVNGGYLMQKDLRYIPMLVSVLLMSVIVAYFPTRKYLPRRFNICAWGNKCLRMFLITSLCSIICQAVMALSIRPDTWKNIAISVAVAFVMEAILFWIGIILVYTTSTQLGIKIRVLGTIFGMVFPINLIMLGKIINTTTREVNFEWKKCLLNEERKEEKICATKYPLLLVHGVFFRDYKLVNYWGRIPDELIRNGATIYYGEHQSALSVKDSGKELAARVKEIVDKTGCRKVNIIAHSKGGLDSRMAVFAHDLEPYVASITTINSPHRGCQFADYLLSVIPDKVTKTTAVTYNAALRKLGDKNPDFIAAVEDLTSNNCAKLDKLMTKPENVYCQSFGSKINKIIDGKFPLNFSYALVKHFDGCNDGLVGEDAFEWGDKYTFLNNKYNVGISHGDIIDLNRENMPGFDVREWYVELVSDLKNKGF